jgi:hypothetical protein
MAADLTPIPGLLAAVGGQGSSVGDAGLSELGEPGKCLEGVADDLLHHLGPGLGLEVAEDEFRVGDDLRQEGQKLTVPTTAGSGELGTNRPLNGTSKCGVKEWKIAVEDCGAQEQAAIAKMRPFSTAKRGDSGFNARKPPDL